MPEVVDKAIAAPIDSQKSPNPATPYQIDKWSEGKFSVNPKGHLCLTAQPQNKEVDLIDIIETMKQRGIQTPCVIRFQDILEEKVHELNQTFNEVIKEYEYGGDYCGVFPIKVNQMREVVEEIVSAGKTYRYGLEAGSKAELLAVLAYNQNRNAVSIVNGYKDEEFIRLCLLGLKMGHNLIIVVESLTEIETTLKLSKEMNLEPQLGFRIKTSAKGLGKWANSAGEQAKFGLGLSDLMNGFYMLKKQNKVDCLKLVHFHLGSQLSDIKVFREGLTEVSRVYCELKKMGAGLEFLDVGGGLAVDYDGSKSSAYSSKNYSLLEYVQTVVDSIQQTCSEAKVPVPHLITESGRFITAHHSCIVTEVVDVISPTRQLKHHTPPVITKSTYYENMLYAYDEMNADNLQSTYHDIVFIKKQTLESFRLGHVSLAEHSQIDELYWAALEKYRDIAKTLDELPESAQEVEEFCTKQYLCNLSIFQSAADSWAIGQLLPIVPLHRLNETPTENCTIADITCDSDGKIERFIQCKHDDEVFKLHPFEPGQPYYLGLFLTGAYQDVMGDNHNLFGRLNEIHIYRDDNSDQGFYIEEFIPGSSKSMVLSTMQYHDRVMSEKVMAQLEFQMQQNKLNHREAKEILKEYNQSLNQYTYLNSSSWEM